MKTIKILFLLTITFQISNLNQLCAKSSMISLSRIQNKVKQALEQTANQTKEEFKDFLKKQKDKIDKDDGRNSLAKVITTLGGSVVQGLDIHGRELRKHLNKAEQFSSSLTWGNQVELIKELEKANSESKEKIRQLLQNKILEKYPTAKIPLISFATALDKEISSLEEILNEFEVILKNKKDIKDNTALNRLPKMLEDLEQIKNNLEKLSEITSNLLS